MKRKFPFRLRLCVSMRRRLMRVLAGLLAALFAQVPLHAAGLGIDALERFFNEIETIQASFGQVVLDENLNAIDDSRGTVWIKRPGRFRWNYEPPDAQEIVGDGERVWLHDIPLEQVTVRDQAQTLGRAPAVLLAGSADLTSAYTVSDLGTLGRFDWVSLVPADAQSGFAEVRIGFEDRRLRVMELIDTLDQRTRISFIDLRENQPLADGIFEFVPPAGVDVIDQSNP